MFQSQPPTFWSFVLKNEINNNRSRLTSQYCASTGIESLEEKWKCGIVNWLIQTLPSQAGPEVELVKTNFAGSISVGGTISL